MQLKNNIVVILGAGRTGSSLLTRILMLLGMSGTKNYVRGVEHNPEGVFEDIDILEVHKEIFSFLDIHPYSPVPNDFLNTKGINLYLGKLKSVVSEKISEAEGVWGFKDPRTASLMPLWLRIFNPLKLVPKYIVTVRDPSSVVTSMNRQFNDSHYEAELVWLIRTCDALYYSGGNCFIVHYEDWFSNKASDLAKGLIDFIGLEVSSAESCKDLSRVVKKSLNRSSYEKYEIKNPYVKKLYAELEECHGDDFNHERLMKIVVECRQAIQSFLPLSTFSKKQQNKATRVAKNINKKLKVVNNKLKSNIHDKASECEALSADNSDLVVRQNELLIEQLENRKLLRKLNRKTQRFSFLKSLLKANFVKERM